MTTLSSDPQPAAALPWVRRWWWTLFLTVPAFGILGVGAAVWWLDRGAPVNERGIADNGSSLFRSRVVLQILRDRDDWRVASREAADRLPLLPANFIATQSAVLASKETLYDVVDQLNLPEQWQLERGEAAGRIAERLSVRMIDETDLVELTYADENAERARDIANSITRAYWDRCEALREQRSRNALDALHRRLKDQSLRVEEARLRMLDLAERYRIVDLAAMNGDPVSSGDPVTGQGTILTTSMTDTFRKTAEVAELTMQIDHLKELGSDGLADGLKAIGLEDPELERLATEVRVLRMKRDRMQASGLGSEHPEVKMVVSELEAADAQLAGRAESLKSMLETKRTLAEKAIDLAKTLEEGEKDHAMDERRKIAEYSDASQHYHFQRDLMRDFQAAYSEAAERASLPQTPFVIHEAAETATVPDDSATDRFPFRLDSAATPAEQALPKEVVKFLVYGAGAGLVLGLLMAVPMMRMFEFVFGPRRRVASSDGD